MIPIISADMHGCWFQIIIQFLPAFVDRELRKRGAGLRPSAPTWFFFSLSASVGDGKLTRSSFFYLINDLHSRSARRSKNMSGKKAIIVGGGIGGLCAALNMAGGSI